MRRKANDSPQGSESFCPSQLPKQLGQGEHQTMVNVLPSKTRHPLEDSEPAPTTSFVNFSLKRRMVYKEDELMVHTIGMIGYTNLLEKSQQQS